MDPDVKAILTTHKHADHSGGNQEMASTFSNI